MSDLLVDVVAKRSRDPEQLRLLAERLHVPLSREWLRTLRWAGRNVLICGTDEAAAARVLSAAKDAGIETAVRPARAAPAHMRFVAAHAQSIARAFFLLTALGSFLKLYFFRGYNPFVHFAGLLWLNLVTRNQTVFEIVGPLAAVGLSLLIGYLAMISVHVNLAWLRLSRPLVSYAHAPGNEILPLPPIRSPDPRKWWPAVAVICGLAAVATGGWLLKSIYAPPPRERPRRPPDTRAERTRPVTTVAPALRRAQPRHRGTAGAVRGRSAAGVLAYRRGGRLRVGHPGARRRTGGLGEGDARLLRPLSGTWQPRRCARVCAPRRQVHGRYAGVRCRGDAAEPWRGDGRPRQGPHASPEAGRGDARAAPPAGSVVDAGFPEASHR